MSVTRRRWLLLAGLLLLPLITALALYAPALRLPFFWDDFPQYAFATSKSYFQLWTDASGLPYYRPLTFTINKLFFSLLPAGATLLPHLFVLAGHILAAALAGYVAGVMSAGPGRPLGRAGQAVMLVTAVLFAAYPFASLSVSYFSGANHVWLAAVTLAGLAAVLYHARHGSQLALVVGLAAALAAPTVHEAGVVAGTVMAACLWVYDPKLARRQWWLPLALVLASAAFLPIWLVVPKTRDLNAAGLALGSAPEVLAKLSFFLQAPSYPFQPLAALLIERFQFWDLGAIWLCGLPPLAAAAAWLWRRGQGRVVAAAAVWIGLTALPTVAALHFDYISTSQRLLLYPGPLAAGLWAVVLVELARAGRRGLPRALGWGAAAMLAAAALAVPVVYVANEVQLNVLALAPLQQLDDMARQYPNDRHLIINTVNWMSYSRAWYPLGHDGMTVLAPYLSVFDLIYINTGVRLAGAAATFPDLLPTLREHYLATANDEPNELWDTSTFAGQAAGYDHVWMTTYTDSSAATTEVGHIGAAPMPAPAQFLGRFENSVYLVSGSVRVAGGSADVTLDWLYLGPDPQATIFRNVFDCAGDVLGLGSGHALGTMLPLGGLAAGTPVHDVRRIALEGTAPDGCYQVEVGLFRADGSRVPVFDAAGQALPNDLVLLRP